MSHSDTRLEQQTVAAGDSTRGGGKNVAPVTTLKTGTWEWDLNGRGDVWSDSLWTIFGLKPHDRPPGYQTWRELVHPSDGKRIDRSLREATRVGVGFSLEYRIRRPDGRVRRLVMRGNPVSTPDGRIERYVAVTLDITGRGRRAVHETMRAMWDSDERFRALVETTFDWIWEVDAEGRYTYASPRVLDMLGYRPEELLGRTPFDLMPAAEASRVRKIFRRNADRREPISVLENVNLHKDGRQVVLETSAMPMLGPGGELLGYRGVDRDITVRKKAEEERDRILDMSRDLICVAGMDGYFKYVNTAWERTLGYSREELLSRPFLDFIHPDDHRKNDREVESLASGQVTNDFENRYVHKNGSVRTFRWTGTPLPEEGIMYCVGRDVTELKRAEESRRKADAQMIQVQKLESLGVLAGGIAHDFNNLLAGIIGNIELARMDLPETSPLNDALRDAEAAGHQAAELCRQMLVYAGRGTGKTGRLSLGRLVEEVGLMVQASVSGRVNIRYELAEDLPDVDGDSTQLRQVVMNLIINAAEAMDEEGGTVTVSTGVAEHDSARAVGTAAGTGPAGLCPYIEVADGGCGMDDATLRRIFEPFFTTKFVGRGLGLAAVLGIVGRHGGVIEVRTEIGKGSAFRMLLPPLPAPVRAEPGCGPKKLTTGSWKGRGTVLLADDEPRVRAVGKRMLERMGFGVLIATNGAEAVRLFMDAGQRGGITCVMLDLTMPGIDGRGALLQIRQISRDVPVIICSGYCGRDMTDSFAGEQVARFIRKPYRFQDLKATLCKVLGG